MRFRWLNDYWQGVTLGAGGIVLSLWLAINGKLVLYIHPRYIIFTVIMCSIGLLLIIISFWQHRGRLDFTKKQTAGSIGLSVVGIILVASMLITQPSSLTSNTATQRGINEGALDLTTTNTQQNGPTDYSQLSVKAWASLLSQTSDPAFFKDKQVHVSGFVSPADNNPDIFYVSRFVMTCCAVDVRPVGVPVYLPNWKSTYKADQWVEVTGQFTKSPIPSDPALVLQQATIQPIKEPEDPYVR